MAKKGNRVIFGFACNVCKNRNYYSTKNNINTKDKLTPKKYCKHCRKITEHSESSKLG